MTLEVPEMHLRLHLQQVRIIQCMMGTALSVVGQQA